jgi:hypothetical protein
MSIGDYRSEALKKWPGAFERFDGVYFPQPGADAKKVGGDWKEAATGEKTPRKRPPLTNFEMGLLHELNQSLNTIGFLYDCLQEPRFNTHAYPQQTRDRMTQIKGILERTIGVPKCCIHSFHAPGCPSCEESLKFRQEHIFDERLGW